MMIGLARGTVKLVPFQDEWKEMFEAEAKLLRSLMGDAVLSVEHVGSTAIAGMCSKPIIDLMIAVEDLEGSRTWVGDLGKLGYEFRPNVEPPDRLFFAKGERSCRTHHLSLTEPSSDFFREKIAFRDHLRGDQASRAEYMQLKMTLADQFSEDRTKYTDGKEAFVRKILAIAVK